MNLDSGKTYLITHSRKGTFMAHITSQDDTWTKGYVVGGKTKAMCDYNIKEKGDEITFRTSFVQKAIEQP